MSSNALVQNIKNYISGSHRFLNIGTGSNIDLNTLVTLPKSTIMTIENGNVGIGTTKPIQELHVVGDSIITGNLGVGTTIAKYPIDVVGDINFSGILRQAGLPYVSSQWSSNGTSLYYNVGNVGIGTAQPTDKLYVVGNIVSTGSVTAPTFNGTATRVSNNHVNGAYLTGGNYNGAGVITWAVDADTNNTANKVVARDASGNFSAGTITASLSGNATTATKVTSDLVRGNYLTGTNYNGVSTTTWAVDADTNNTANKVVARDASGNFSAGTITATLSGTATRVSNNHVNGAYLTGGNYNGVGVVTWAVDADSNNTANKVVVRDASGNFSAGTITASLSGNATTANKVNNDLVRGNYLTGVNYNGISSTTWAVDASTTATANKIVARDASGAIYAANVGIGTTAALYPLDVVGNINFTGTLMQNGSPYVSSQWTTIGGGIYYNSGNVGIGNTQPLEKLHVTGNILSTGTVTASNLVILGDTTILNTVTSNTEQLVINNAGTGPALRVFQSGTQPVAEFYDVESGQSMCITNTGLVGINSTAPANRLDVGGNTYINGTLLVNGTVTTNNNNINAGSGTVTAATFAGTATRVSNNLVNGSYLTGGNYNGAGVITWAVDADTNNIGNKVVVRDASGNFSAGTITATLTGTATRVSNNHIPGSYLTGGNYNGAGVITWAVDADTNNTANKVVVRDASGNFSASTITANLTGNATTANKVNNDLVRGSYLTGTNYNGAGTTTWAVDADSNNTGNKVVVRDSSGNFSAGTITASLSGNATSANKVNNDLIRGSYLTGNNYNGSVAITWTVDADSNNTGNKIVVRDASGNFSAGTITATLSGTATRVSNNHVPGSYLTGGNYNGAGVITWAVDADTNNIGNKVVVRDGSGNFSAGTITATLIGTATRVSNNHVPGSYLTGGNYNGVAVATWAVDADSNNTANKVVVRDGSGNFSAGTITASLTGNATTANKVNNNLVRGAYLTGTNYNGAGTTTWAVDADTNNTGNKVVVRDASGNFSAGTITATLTGNATTANKVNNDLVRGNYLTGFNYNGISTTIWAVDADTNNTANKVVVRDASGNFSAGTITASLTGTATRVSNNHVNGAYLTGGNYNGVGVITWAVDADSNNTASKVVVRDGSGNFSAGTITANLTGTATKVSTDLVRGNYLTGVNYNGVSTTTWAVDADSNNTANKVVARNASGNFSAGTITATLTGTATRVSNNHVPGSYLLGGNYNGAGVTTWTVDATTAATGSKIVARDASGAIYAANVGIGTTIALYPLDVVGNINFTGTLMQNGSPYVSSQWTTIGGGIYYNSGNVGIGNTQPLEKLHVTGNILSTGTVTASNLVILGDTTILNTMTSNTEQLVINNAGTGPALRVFQSGPQPVAEFYDVESGQSMCITNTGLVGINSTAPANRLDVGGNTYINGTLLVNGTVTTNNNNINAGSGTVTAATFAGTATRVSNNLVNGSYLTGGNYNGAGVITWAVDADTNNTANKVVVRDASGNFSAGTITATLTGTATKVSNNLVNSSYLLGGNYNGAGVAVWSVDATTTATANKIVARDGFGNIYAANVGIGTTVARQLLDVQGGNAIVSGRMGIATATPSYTLDVVGDMNYTGTFYRNGVPVSLWSSNITTNSIYYNAGNIGVGVTSPAVTLDVNGTIQTSNLRILGNITYGPNDSVGTGIQVTPVRQVFYVQTPTQNTFTLTKTGIYGGHASNVQVFIGQNLLSYYSSNINDYNLSISYTSTNTIYTVTLTDSVDYATVVDITVWPTLLPTSSPQGYVNQTITISSSSSLTKYYNLQVTCNQSWPNSITTYKPMIYRGYNITSNTWYYIDYTIRGASGGGPANATSSGFTFKIGNTVGLSAMDNISISILATVAPGETSTLTVSSGTITTLPFTTGATFSWSSTNYDINFTGYFRAQATGPLIPLYSAAGNTPNITFGAPGSLSIIEGVQPYYGTSNTTDWTNYSGS